MKNKKNKFSLFKIPIIIVIVLALTSFVWGAYNGYTDAQDKSTYIMRALESNCDCKSIEQSVYLSGIQFGKDGISKERGEYQLIDCNFTSLDQESERILEILEKKVKHFKELDHLELEFINNDISQIVIIKNGIIQKSKT
jgi:hypothetical protein